MVAIIFSFLSLYFHMYIYFKPKVFQKKKLPVPGISKPSKNRWFFPCFFSGSLTFRFFSKSVSGAGTTKILFSGRFWGRGFQKMGNCWLYTYITGLITVKEPPNAGFYTFAEVHPTSRSTSVGASFQTSFRS